MRHLNVFLVSMLMFGALQVEAGGLTLYSYKDNAGQTIVVDSIDRIPKEYRESAHCGFIPSFKDSEAEIQKKKAEKNTAKKSTEKAANKGDKTSSSSAGAGTSTYSSASGELTVIEPAKDVEPQLPAASNAMQNMRNIIQNFGLVVTSTTTKGIADVSVAQFHMASGQLIDRLRLPAMETANGKKWLTASNAFAEESRRVQNFIMRWILNKDQQGLLTDLPIMYNALQMTLLKIEDLYLALQPANSLLK